MTPKDCTCVVPQIGSTNFCEACSGYIVQERLEALQRAKEQRDREGLKRPGSLIIQPSQSRASRLAMATLAAAAAMPAQPAPDLAPSENERSIILKGAKPREMRPRRTVDIRRVKSSRELFEAYEMAKEGTPIPGTLAAEKLRIAVEKGDLAGQKSIRFQIKAFAPQIKKAAEAAKEKEAREAEQHHRSITGGVQRSEKAQAKRDRKKAARARASEANMRHGARER
jgi:hypothetical protein